MKNRMNSSLSSNHPDAKQLLQQAIESILSPNRQRRLLPSLLSLSFFNGAPPPPQHLGQELCSVHTLQWHCSVRMREGLTLYFCCYVRNKQDEYQGGGGEGELLSACTQIFVKGFKLLIQNNCPPIQDPADRDGPGAGRRKQDGRGISQEELVGQDHRIIDDRIEMSIKGRQIRHKVGLSQ